jgi:hypothetical protein
LQEGTITDSVHARAGRSATAAWMQAILVLNRWTEQTFFVHLGQLDLDRMRCLIGWMSIPGRLWLVELTFHLFIFDQNIDLVLLIATNTMVRSHEKIT